MNVCVCVCVCARARVCRRVGVGGCGWVYMVTVAKMFALLLNVSDFSSLH